MDASSWCQGHSSTFCLKTVSHSNSGELNDKGSLIPEYAMWISANTKNTLNFCDYVIGISEREDKDVKKKNPIQSRQYCLPELMDIKEKVNIVI